MVNDPIGDMIIQMKNGSLVGRKLIMLPYSKEKERVAHILKKEGYLALVEVCQKNLKKQLKLTLAYKGSVPVLTDVKRRSKPGIRMYIKKTEIPTVLGGVGVAVLSTPEGIMTGAQARKRGIGGELLFEIW
jgi:small subunit ribosomal protein S8